MAKIRPLPGWALCKTLEARTTSSGGILLVTDVDKNVTSEGVAQVLEINPKDGGAYYDRGVAKQALNDFYGAIADYTKALTLDPNNLDALYNRGWLRTDNKIKNYDGAIADFIKLTELEPNSVANIIDLATAYSYANKNKKAYI